MTYDGITGHPGPAVVSRAFTHDSRAAFASLTTLAAIDAGVCCPVTASPSRARPPTPPPRHAARACTNQPATTQTKRAAAAAPYGLERRDGSASTVTPKQLRHITFAGSSRTINAQVSCVLKILCVRTGRVLGGPCTVRARGLTKLFDDVVALDESTWMSHPGRSTGSSGRTGRGRRRCSASCLASPLPDGGSLEVLGDAGRARARGARRRHGLRRRPRPVPRADRPGEPRRAGRLRGPGARRQGSTTSLSRSGSPTSPTTRCAASPSECASGSASPPPCSPSRACSCSTSLPTASTRRASGTCTGPSPGSRRTGPP